MDPQRIILGCGNFGGIGSLPELYGRGDSMLDALAVLDLAREFGLRRFDTANSYGGGASEETVGEWLSRQSASFRAEVRIATKVGNSHGSRPGRAALCADEIRFHLQRSLERLGIEQIDTYYLHEFPPDEHLGEVFEALERALAAGNIASFGLSNVTLTNVKTFMALAGDRLNSHLSHIQNEFHVLKTSDQNGLLPFLEKHEIKYSAYSPLAGGLLTGKYSLRSLPPEGSRLSLRSEPYAHYLDGDGFKKIETFVENARSENLKPAQAALQFVLQNPFIDSAIIGPRTKKHFEDLGFNALSW